MPGFSAGASIIGATKQANAASKATRTQIKFARENRELARNQAKTAAKQGRKIVNSSFRFQRKKSNDLYRRDVATLKETRDRTTAPLNAFASQGQKAAAAQAYELGLGEAPEGYEGFKGTEGYKFRRGEALDAVENSASAGGSLLSGATLRRLQQTGDGLAADEYGANFNRLNVMADRGYGASRNISEIESQYGANLVEADRGRTGAIRLAEAGRADARLGLNTARVNTILGASTEANNTISDAVSNNAFAQANAWQAGAQGVAGALRDGVTLAQGLT